MGDPLSKARCALAKTGGASAERHIFLCALAEKGKCCSRSEGAAAWKFLKHRLKELGRPGGEGHGTRIARTKADCLQICAAGPVAVFLRAVFGIRQKGVHEPRDEQIAHLERHGHALKDRRNGELLRHAGNQPL